MSYYKLIIYSVMVSYKYYRTLYMKFTINKNIIIICTIAIKQYDTKNVMAP